MQVINPDQLLFKELEEFLQYYYSDVIYPISILRPTLAFPQILFNTEQLTRNDIQNIITLYKNNEHIIEIWDYSLANISIWNSFGIYNVKHTPFKIWPSYRDKLLSYNSEQKYNFDIGFVGWVHGSKRIDMLQEIIKHNISIDIIENVYGEERDKRLAKCKILLNIHFDNDYQIFEQLRCFAWRDIGKIIVSENSLDNDDKCINVPYNQIITTLLGLL